MLGYAITALALLLTASAIYVAASDRLLLFNRLVPKDKGSGQVARDVAFGEGVRQRLDIYAPRGSRTEMAAGPALPVIVFIHGGGWREGDKAGYEFAGRALAAQGFVTVVTNYRLSPEHRFPDFVEDAVAAVRWTGTNIAAHGGDPERLVLAGHSAGAHIAALIAMDERWLGAAHDAIIGWVGISGPYDFLPLDTPATIGAFGQVADPLTTQPIHFVSADDPPALLLHGDADDVVNPRQTRRLARALDAAGVPVEAKIYSGIGHIRIMTAISRWGRSDVPTLRDISAFVHEMAGE